jgi:predicted enzyme related to lactoylglutathione lyase
MVVYLFMCTTIKGDKKMNIIATSIFVEDQEKALRFYTETLEFVKKHDVPAGEYRWIALVSPDNQNGTELILEPNNHPAAKEYQTKLFAEGIPVTMFVVADIDAEYQRLVDKGVKFTMKPTKMGEFSIAVFDDTCGNLIQIIQQ